MPLKCKKSLVLVAFSFVFLHCSSALAATCRMDIARPSVSVEIYEGPVRNNNGHSSSQLAAKFGAGHGKKAPGKGWETRGLTKTDLESRIEVGVQYRQIAKNQICMGLQKVVARVGYKQFRVYVSRSLKPGSCEYRTTMGHEMAHVAIYRDQLRLFAPRFEQRLKRVAAQVKPIISRSSKAGHAYFLKKINSEFKQVFRQLNRETDSRQGRLDTPENYRREQALCPARPRLKKQILKKLR